MLPRSPRRRRPGRRPVDPFTAGTALISPGGPAGVLRTYLDPTRPTIDSVALVAGDLRKLDIVFREDMADPGPVHTVFDAYSDEVPHDGWMKGIATERMNARRWRITYPYNIQQTNDDDSGATMWVWDPSVYTWRAADGVRVLQVCSGWTIPG